MGNKCMLRDTISEFPIFKDVHLSDLDELMDEGTLLKYKKNETILREGEKLHTFYVVLHGMVKVFKVSIGGREFTIDWRYSGDILGWGQVMRGGSFKTTYAALEDTSILSFNREPFLSFLSGNPVMKKRISNLDIVLIDKLFDKLVDIADDTANNRLVRTLIVLQKRSGNTLCLTHQEIAQMSWMTLETTTRILSELKKEGIISTKRGMVIINDSDRLEEMV